MTSEQISKPLAKLDETSLSYMLKLAAPMIVTNISFTIMQFVDRLMVSRLGTNELAAILPAGVVSFLPGSFAIGVLTSVSTFTSQSFGRGENRECPKYCWQGIYMGLAYFAIVIAIMWPWSGWIFKAMGHEGAIIEMEVAYLRIMLYSQMIAVLIHASSQFFMGVHRPVITMYAAIIGQLVNVGCNYVLIFGKFGFPQMGIRGAAWGTFIGIVVGAGIRMWVFMGSGINEKFHSRSSLRPDLGKMKDLLKVGLPAGFGLMVNVSLWAMILLGLVGRFGKEAVAATSAVFSYINISVMPIVGIGTALTAAVGKSIGAGRNDIAKKQTSICLRIGLTYMGFVGLCFFVFRDNLMAMWSTDSKVIDTGVKILICAAIFQVFDAATIIYNGSLRGAGDTVWIAAMSAIGAIVILGGGGWVILNYFEELGIIGPWIAATVNIIAVGIANRWRFKSGRWMEIDLFRQRPAGVAVEIETAIE